MPHCRCPALPQQTYQSKLSGLRIVGGVVRSSGVAAFRTTAAGQLFFSCQIWGHCRDGQIIK